MTWGTFDIVFGVTLILIFIPKKLIFCLFIVVRASKRKLGCRPYKNYDDSKLNEALCNIADKELSILAANKIY